MLHVLILISAAANAVDSVRHYVSVLTVEPYVYEDPNESFGGINFRSAPGRDSNLFRPNQRFEENLGFIDSQGFDNNNNNPRINQNPAVFNNMGSNNNMGQNSNMGPGNNMGPINNIPINNIPINNPGFNDNRAMHREVNYREDERRFRAEFQSNDYFTTVNHASVNLIPSDQPNQRPEYHLNGNHNQGYHQNANNNHGLPQNTNNNQGVYNNPSKVPPELVSRNHNIAPTRMLQPQLEDERHTSGVNHKHARDNAQQGKFHASVHSNLVPQGQTHTGNPTNHNTGINNEQKASRPHSTSDGMSSTLPQRSKFQQGHYVPAPIAKQQISGEQMSSKQHIQGQQHHPKQILGQQVNPKHQISGHHANPRQQLSGQQVNPSQQIPGQTVGLNMNVLGYANGHNPQRMNPIDGRINVGADSVVHLSRTKCTSVSPNKAKVNRRVTRTIHGTGNDSQSNLLLKLLLAGFSQESQKGNGNSSGSSGQGGSSISTFGSGGSNLFGHLLGGQHGIGFPSIFGQNLPGIGSSSLLSGLGSSSLLSGLGSSSLLSGLGSSSLLAGVAPSNLLSLGIGGNPIRNLLAGSGAGNGTVLKALSIPRNITALQGLLGQGING